MALKGNRFVNLLVFTLTLTFCAGITEITARFLLEDRLKIVEDERNLTYRYDKALGWFPVENSKKILRAGRVIDVEHNSRGFRDAEHIIDTKPSIMFLGDSFLWGYDVKKQERFTEKLDEKLVGWSLFNLGVSAFGTDQEYLLLKQHFDFYHPNIVFLLFCTQNDEDDNSHNIVYGGYYKPYFIVDEDRLELKGVPVPKSQNYFFVHHNILSQSYSFRLFAKAYFKYIAFSPPSLEINNPTYAIIANMNQFVKTKGAKFLVGLTGENPDLEEFLMKENIPYIDLENPHRYPTHGGHWTPDGHTFVSEKIYNFLMKDKFLAIISD